MCNRSIFSARKYFHWKSPKKYSFDKHQNRLVDFKLFEWINDISMQMENSSRFCVMSNVGFIYFISSFFMSNEKLSRRNMLMTEKVSFSHDFSRKRCISVNLIAENLSIHFHEGRKNAHLIDFWKRC